MHSIKYVSTDKTQHEFFATVRKNVNQYFQEKGISKQANGSMFMKTIGMLAIYLVPFVLILTVAMPVWVALILTIVMGFGVAGVGMGVMHDAVHHSYSKKIWVNKLFGGTLYLLGANVLNWKVQHNILHHTYTNIEGLDEDIDAPGPLRLSEQQPLKKIHKYQYIHAFFFYGLLTITKLILDFVQLKKYNEVGLTHAQNANPKAEYIKMAIRKTAYLIVIIGLPLLLTDFLWWQVLLGFVIMHWTSGLILSIIFQLAHIVEGAHQPIPTSEGTIENDWAVHQLKTTADFARNSHFLNWYVGGLNFQIEHHLFPNICHIHYKKISPIVEKTAKEFGLPYNLKPTLLSALASHVQRLKELGMPDGKLSS